MKAQLLKSILDSTKKGEIDGFEKLYILTYYDVYHQAYSIIQDDKTAWEIVKYTYVKLYLNRETLPEDSMIKQKLEELVEEISYKMLGKEAEDIGEITGAIMVSEDKASLILLEIEQEAKILDMGVKEDKEIDYVFSAGKAILSLGVVILAMYVIISGISKVKTYNKAMEDIWNSKLMQVAIDSGEDTTVDAEMALTADGIRSKEINLGWVITVGGKKFRDLDSNFLIDTWKNIDGLLYYFDGDGYMVKGQKTIGRQIFIFSQEGQLSYIKNDLYGEIDVMSSMQEVDDWNYYLKRSAGASDSRYVYDLFRTMDTEAGTGTKEVIEENIDDYFVWGNTIYYIKDGTFRQLTDTGTNKFQVVEMEPEIIEKDGAFYLMDEFENPIMGGDDESIKIGEVNYWVNGGRIESAKQALQVIGGTSYFIKEEGAELQNLYWQTGSGESGLLASEGYSIDSFCVVDEWVYYSAYIDKTENGQKYSCIYRINSKGTIKEQVSKKFLGNMLNLYYYNDKQRIYGEYVPQSDSQYGKIAVISLGGIIQTIDDSKVRSTEGTTGQDMLELIMVSGDNIYCYWHDLDWSDSKVPKILWTKPIILSNSERLSLQSYSSKK